VNFLERMMNFDSILLMFFGREERSDLKITPKQKEAQQEIVLDSQDCLKVLPKGYGKSLIYFYFLYLTVLRRPLGAKDRSKEKLIVIA